MFTTGKFIGFMFFAAALMAGCTGHATGAPIPPPPQGNNPYAPQPSDAGMMQSKIEIVSASVITTESMPPQVSVALADRLPTPCNDLRVNISRPNQENRILLEVYSVAPKDKPCTLMALATPQQVTIDLGSFPAGQYTVWVNGVQASGFNS